MVLQAVQQGLLVLEGEERTAPEPFDQSVDDYVRLLGSTSTLSRVTLGSRAAEFRSRVPRSVRAASDESDPLHHRRLRGLEHADLSRRAIVVPSL